MKYLGYLLVFMTSYVNAGNSYPDFYHQQTYRQVLKDLVLARCLAQVADKGSKFSADAARSASAFIEWIPFDAENGTDKVNVLIGKYINQINGFHSERKPDVKGVTLNCLRLYHSDELNELAPQLIIGNPDRTWLQDNPQE
ncbi:type VI secretion system amidase immunity protein Tai4 [Enterobacter bugandensis]|uniref:T6SS amidase immunity protein Tai4 family protein n=1 Tax=Enterobacter bugandensis TaxID=881260 RepID=UPI001E2C9F21|nr:T6SS amidase immunity protein Tai4 family protein [Enterobacter bugandensis]MCE1391703.1 type VI secretion system amidase immunity protein Tai4 [Enterobacter bugandensis]MCK7067751.1 type VI secretion system amidase immunity protein Tai4 [Enterobacter bugandensis]